MAENRTSDQPADAVVPQARPAAEPAGEPARPRKRASRARKAATAQPAKQAATRAPRKAPKKSAPAAPAPTRTPAPTKAPTQVKAPDRVELPAVPPGAWASAAWEALRHLDEPPRRLAELAVAELGPRAAAWARWLRDTYPGAPPAGIARLAARQAVRAGRVLTVLEVGGPLAAPVHLPAYAWVRAMLVLRLAAAHGLDPTAPDRVDDLLELLELVPAGTDRRWSVAAYALGRIRLRRPRALAGAARVLLAASEQGDELDRLAHRAIRRYRAAGRAQPGSQET